MFVNQVPLAGLDGLTLHVIRTEAVHTTDLSVRGEIIVLGATRLDLELVGFPSITPKFAASWSGVPPGFILQLRFIVESATITVQGVEYDVKIPSGGQTGFKVIAAETLVEIIDQAETEVTVQLDPDKSLLNNLGQGFILKPVVKVLSGQVTSLPINVFRPDELIVLFEDTATEQEMTDLIAAADTEVIYRSPYSPFFGLRTPSGTTPDEVRVIFEDSDIVVAVEKNAIGYNLGGPYVFLDGEKAFADQWYLENTGQCSDDEIPETGGDISALEAWGITTGDHDVIIATVDSGFDITHPDILGNIWVNPGEIADNSIDDEGNGFDDDVNGWNFVGENNVIDDTDTAYHGTATGSVIAAKGDNGYLAFIAGVMFDVQLMPVKTSNIVAGLERPADADLTAGHWLAGMEYAVENGAIITNTSSIWFVDQTAADNYKLDFDRMVGAKGLHCFAAGNETLNIDNDPLFFFPAELDIPNSIVVTASTPDDTRWPSANVGSTSVDVAAPGQWILGLLPDTGFGPEYGQFSGTSFASPIAAGVAGLVASVGPRLRSFPRVIKRLIMESVDPVSEFSKTVSGGRINAFKALVAAQKEVPIIHPTGREKWLSGSRAVIRWVMRGPPALLRIEYSTDGGNTYPNLIVDSTEESAGFFEWTVPDIVSKTVRIRFQDLATAEIVGRSIEDFTISSIVRIMPLGDSITHGLNEIAMSGIDASPFVRPSPSPETFSYRKELFAKLKEAIGVSSFDFVGTQTRDQPSDPSFEDRDHEGHSGWSTATFLNQDQETGKPRITKMLDDLGGETSLDGTDEIPHIALIHLGTNDLNRQYAIPVPAAIKDSLVLLINRLRAANPAMRILVAKIIPRPLTYGYYPGNIWDDDITALNDDINNGIATIPTEVNVPPFTDYPVLVVDPNTGFDQSVSAGFDPWVSDGLHPNFKGDRIIAEKWFDGLARVSADLGGLVVSPPGLIQVDELDAGEVSDDSFTIALRYEPASDVVVEVRRSSGDTDLDAEDVAGVSPVDLTFTSANYSTPQTVTLTAADDDDGINDSAIFTLTVVDSVTGQRWLAFVRAEEVDDDFYLVVTTPDPPGELGKPYDPLMVPTSGTATFNVALSKNPTADVTVTVSALLFPENTNITIAVGEETLYFTITDGTVEQAVTLEIITTSFEEGCQGFEVAAPGRAPVEVIARQDRWTP